MKVVLSLFILLALPFQELFAQSFKGKIIDATTKETLSFANVVLLQAVDSAFVTGTVSGDDGTFSLVPPAKKSILRISLIGYETYMEPFHSQNQSIIALTPKQEMLSEVVVTGHARLFKMENGGISADIQNTPLKTIGNLSEVLGQMPFVTKTDNTLTVLGKGTPIVYINNRLVRDNNELLRINSKDIKKVTVITNPGAEYDASVNAVIKVETSRPVGEGLSMELWTYNRYNSEWYTQDQFSLNYRTGKLDLFASIEYANVSLPKDRTQTYNIQVTDDNRSIVSKRKDVDILKFYTPQGGFNYMINDHHSLGARYEYSDTYDDAFNYDIETEVSTSYLQEPTVHTHTTGDTQAHSHYINAYYNGKASDWLTVKLDLDYKTAKEAGLNDAINTSDKSEKDILKTSNQIKYDLYAGKLTLETPLWNGNLTYGAEGAHTHNEQFYNINENSGITGVSTSTNRVTQKLFAGFISYNRSLGLFSGNIGVRYENVSSEYFQNSQLIGEQSKTHRRLFPTFSLTYNQDNIRMELAYRNSVSRPSYQSLRSSITYMGPYKYVSGNPLLQPTYTNNLTYMVNWKYFTFMGVYKKSKDFQAQIPEIYMENSILMKNTNISKARFLNLSLNYSSNIGIWRPNWDIVYSQNYITFGEPAISHNKPIFSTNLRNGFSIKGWNFGIDMRFRTKGDNEYLEYNEKVSWSTNIYLNTSFFKEQLSIGISGNDIFNTYSDDISQQFNGINSYWENNMYRRNIIFSMTYRFNTSTKRYKGENASNEIWRL
ncbi:outer membrane beta-barrel family protein [Parabacteroides sp.]|uniref:outer membrane beta-barrel family protein n=1 Tax=Parabacteroides sp. TaxID=1869337 RepID=UPI00257D4635|nr:outer membrane beta-barrel family protein [Parabacteroides sp.]